MGYGRSAHSASPRPPSSFSPDQSPQARSNAARQSSGAGVRVTPSNVRPRRQAGRYGRTRTGSGSGWSTGRPRTTRPLGWGMSTKPGEGSDALQYNYDCLGHQALAGNRLVDPVSDRAVLEGPAGSTTSHLADEPSIDDDPEAATRAELPLALAHGAPNLEWSSAGTSALLDFGSHLPSRYLRRRRPRAGRRSRNRPAWPARPDAPDVRDSAPIMCGAVRICPTTGPRDQSVCRLAVTVIRDPDRHSRPTRKGESGQGRSSLRRCMGRHRRVGNPSRLHVRPRRTNRHQPPEG